MQQHWLCSEVQQNSKLLQFDSTHLLNLLMFSRRHLKLSDLSLDLIHFGPAFASNEKPLMYTVISNPCSATVVSGNSLTGLQP